MTKKLKTVFWILGGIFSVGLMIIGTMYDVDISNAIMSRNNELAIIIEFIGSIIPGLFLIFGCVIALNGFLATPKDLDKNKLFKSVLVFIIYVLAVLWVALNTLKAVDIRQYFLYVGVGVLILSIIMTIIISMIDKEKIIKARNIGIIIILSAISILAVVAVLKIFWGRVRPEDLKGGANVFSPWFLPQGITKNTSFPSGHVSNAVPIFSLMLFIPLIKNKIGKFALTVLPIVWVLLMGYTRVLKGKHFLTDVTMGFIIAVLILVVICYFVKKYCYRISLTSEQTLNTEIEKSVEFIPSQNTVISEEVVVENNNDDDVEVLVNETINRFDAKQIDDILNDIKNND